MIWKWLWVANIPENVASVIDNALWDLAGRAFGAAGLQADGRRARQGEGLRLDLPQYRRAAGLCRARAGLQERGLPRLQDPPALLLEPRDPAADARPAVQHQGRHRDHPSRARGGRAGLRADVRPLGHLHVARGGDQGRPRAREARLLLVRASDAGVPGRELCAAEPRALDPDPVAGDRRRRRLQPRRVDPARRRRHEPHRRGARRHHRRAQDRDRLRGLRPALRDAHGGLGQPAGLRRDARRTPPSITRRACWRRASTTTRRTRTSRTPATRSTPRATSTCRRGRAWATRSSGTTSTTT